MKQHLGDRCANVLTAAKRIGCAFSSNGEMWLGESRLPNCLLNDGPQAVARKAVVVHVADEAG